MPGLWLMGTGKLGILRVILRDRALGHTGFVRVVLSWEAPKMGSAQDSVGDALRVSQPLIRSGP